MHLHTLGSNALRQRRLAQTKSNVPQHMAHPSRRGGNGPRDRSASFSRTRHVFRATSVPPFVTSCSPRTTRSADVVSSVSAIPATSRRLRHESPAPPTVVFSPHETLKAPYKLRPLLLTHPFFLTHLCSLHALVTPAMTLFTTLPALVLSALVLAAVNAEAQATRYYLLHPQGQPSFCLAVDTCQSTGDDRFPLVTRQCTGGQEERWTTRLIGDTETITWQPGSDSNACIAANGAYHTFRARRWRVVRGQDRRVGSNGREQGPGKR